MCCQFFFQFLNCLLFYIVIKLQILFVYFIGTDSSTLKTTSLSIKYQATPQMFSNRTNTTWSLRPTTMNTSTMLMKPEFLTYTLLAAHLTSLWTYVKRLKQYFFMHSVKYWWLEFIDINIIGIKMIILHVRELLEPHLWLGLIIFGIFGMLMFKKGSFSSSSAISWFWASSSSSLTSSSFSSCSIASFSSTFVISSKFSSLDSMSSSNDDSPVVKYQTIHILGFI